MLSYKSIKELDEYCRSHLKSVKVRYNRELRRHIHYGFNAQDYPVKFPKIGIRAIPLMNGGENSE